jgi:hypothetical protein
MCGSCDNLPDLSLVIPAKAGIHLDLFISMEKWIPAFAGMTTERGLERRTTHEIL